MKNAFDYLIDGLVKDYGMSSFPEKNFADEVYCFEFENKSIIKIYQDAARWVYFLAEFNNLTNIKNETLKALLSLNQFSSRKPFLTIGLNSHGVVMLHTRVPLADVDSVQMRGIFEDIIVSVNKINEKLNKELNHG